MSKFSFIQLFDDRKIFSYINRPSTNIAKELTVTGKRKTILYDMNFPMSWKRKLKHF